MTHPITPPAELVQRVAMEALDAFPDDEAVKARNEYFANYLAQWGADQELEACCEWLEDTDCDDPQEAARLLRTARRPKPPSLKELALAALGQIEGHAISQMSAYGVHKCLQDGADTIRRALESINE